MTEPTTPPTNIHAGQKWRDARGTEWTTSKGRSRAIGPNQRLLVTPGGAQRWVDELDLTERYTLITE